MQWMSPSVLLRKRMSSKTLEGGVEWTQEEVQQKTNEIKINKSFHKKTFYKSDFYFPNMILL